ncbi:EAL domain-containing protein [Sulfurimonas sp. SAG-AH-194-I05]|nr:EAL domain-containing protein [Sulfurimonas sp. SAG-AH-194-I05]MDF1874458.1 EAL domain-containing protein [Sulfurimonas sp. SAG-AH-194-I05]
MRTFSGTIININDIEVLVSSNGIIDNDKLLIQLFCGSANIDLIKKIQTYFKSSFPKAVLIATTSDGVIDGKNVYEKDVSSIVFSCFEKTTLHASCVAHDDYQQNYFKSGYALASHIVTDTTKLLISFSDGINTNGEEYVNGISEFDSKVMLAGGMAGDNGALAMTYVFDKENIMSNGAVGVTLNSDFLEVHSNYNFDWTPIGKKLSVTKSEGNRVYKIDGVPVVDLYARYLGEELANQLPQIGIEYPLIVDRDGIDTARAVLSRNEDGSLNFAGNIIEGEYIRFGIGNIESILSSAEGNLRNVLTKSSKKVEAFYIYSCMARRRFMGNHIEKELKPFADIATTSGFFTYGEFFHKKGTNQLLNETMTVLSLSESTATNDVMPKGRLVLDRHFTTNPVHTVSHLTNVISKELEELNSTLESRIDMSTKMLFKQAYYNKLTDLPNRLKLLQDLPSNRGNTLILVNIDKFTIINDFYGHEFGDLVLKKIARILKDFSFELEAIIFKLPSDEFAILIQETFEKEYIIRIVKRLLLMVQNYEITHATSTIKIDVTLSAAEIGEGELGLINANMAIKLAKKKGLDYLLFDESLLIHKDYERNIVIAQEIRQAIETNNIIAYYQPIYITGTSTIEKYECLVRLRKANGVILSPFSFLSIAQKIKLYPKITEIMIENTFKYFKDTSYNFSINLAFEDILKKETYAFLFEKIEEYGIGKQLTIEILETQEIDDQVLMHKFIEKIYGTGAKVALDDFGSGFANFHHITSIRADYLKIDGSLIKNIDKDDNAKLVVETIIIFAKKLGMKTVAEFVHSKEVYDIVCELGIDLSQGYYLDEPLATIK